jgi:UDP-glucose 4-epimerase
MNILVTGGAGYIGSITTVQLLAAGLNAVILDNFANSRPAVLARIERVAGRPPAFVQGDVRDRALLERVLRERQIDAVIHFAGLKAVGESVSTPLAYYDNNVHGTVQLLEAMHAANVRTMVFSSSATVYGDAAKMPLHEGLPTSATNPYGRTKLMIEQILADVAASDASWSMTALRYFNPVGAHESGQIGEDPQGVPNNLMPYIAQVAVGRLPRLRVFGDDYPTPDGTGVRDYIHVVDLADGHLAALRYAHGRSCTCSTSAPAAATACSRCSLRSAARAAASCRTKSCRGGPAMSRPAGQIRHAPNRRSAGALRARSSRCAPTRGAGSR